MADDFDLPQSAFGPATPDLAEDTKAPVIPPAPPMPEHPEAMKAADPTPKADNLPKVFQIDPHTRAKLEPIFADGEQYGWQISSRDFAAMQPLHDEHFVREAGELMHDGLPVNVYAS